MTQVVIDGKLEQEKNEIITQIKDIYGEAKSDGLEPKIMRQVIKERLKKKMYMSKRHFLRFIKKL